MNWKTSIIVAAMAGLTLFSAAGCTAAGTTVNAAVTTATTAAVPSPSAFGRHQPFSDDGTIPDFTGNSTRPGGPGGQFGMFRIDWAAAAENLGVTEDDLKAAFGDMTQGLPDFPAIAEKLGVTEDNLKAALGLPENMTPPGDGRNQFQPGERPQGGPPQEDLLQNTPSATPGNNAQ
jgi:hypothetical protein